MELLIAFDVSNNFLNGTLPDSYGKLNHLWLFLVHNNLHLYGTLPDSYGNITYMAIFALSNNYFTGTIPLSYANWKGLFVFNVKNNLLTSNVNTGLAFPENMFDNKYTLIIFEVSYNQFTGNLPRLNSTALLQLRHFAGKTYVELGLCFFCCFCFCVLFCLLL